MPSISSTQATVKFNIAFERRVEASPTSVSIRCTVVLKKKWFIFVVD